MIKILKSSNIAKFDLAIVGLGYESRAIDLCQSNEKALTKVIAIGYDNHKDQFSYNDNYSYYDSLGATIIEGSDDTVYGALFGIIEKSWINKPVNCLVDITVMSRTRLAEILLYLSNNLKEGSKIQVSYSLADYTEPSENISPMRKVGPIVDSLSGQLGDINLPSSIVIGLGYEIGKAIGISNYLDTEKQFLFIPKGENEKFEKSVRKNNQLLIDGTPENHIFTYDVCNPYKTYLELRETMLAIMDVSRPVVVPLGPKIFSALCVVFSLEMKGRVPIWRVSSEHLEEPVDRKASGSRFEFVIAL